MGRGGDLSLTLGVSLDKADFVFLLPNKPILPANTVGSDTMGNYVSDLITLNGNHWRKILTIMAKLSVCKLDLWRQWRDEMLFVNVAIVFEKEQLKTAIGTKFVVGNDFRDEIPISEKAERIGSKNSAYLYLDYLWCPYLDYRQFPNTLIDGLRLSIHSNTLESSCFKH